MIDELQAEMRTATNRDIPLLKGTIRTMADESIDSVDGFPRAGRRFSEEVTAMARRVSDLEARVAQFGEVEASRRNDFGSNQVTEIGVPGQAKHVR